MQCFNDFYITSSQLITKISYHSQHILLAMRFLMPVNVICVHLNNKLFSIDDAELPLATCRSYYKTSGIFKTVMVLLKQYT